VDTEPYGGLCVVDKYSGTWNTAFMFTVL
jgi:hypothetical protein